MLMAQTARRYAGLLICHRDGNVCFACTETSEECRYSRPGAIDSRRVEKVGESSPNGRMHVRHASLMMIGAAIRAA